MANPKDVLVITTSSVEDLKIQKYLKPISAHIVAGTNLFSDFLEFGIFDSIEIIQFDTGSKNVFFIGHDLANTEFTHIANLFKEIYFIYGEDRNSKGFLEEEEVDYFFSDELYTLFRRSWSDMTKHENPIELYIDRSENTINLSIFAVK